MKVLRHLVATACLLAATAASTMPQTKSEATGPQPAKSAGQDEATLRAGRELSRLFLDGKAEEVWSRFSPKMRQAVPDAETLAAFRTQLGTQFGEEQAPISETTREEGGIRVYLRTARWSKAPVSVAMQWAIGADGRVEGFYVRPAQPTNKAAASPHLDYETKAALRLPFEGGWFVAWGGRSLEQNYHAASPDQRFAYDFLKRVDGSSHRGDGAQLADYHCWNQPILAPAAGRVVAAVDGLPDQAIGTTNTDAPAGNHVMLDLGNGEYALLAHFRQGSLQVEADDRVAAGDVLGRCGNSGNTSEPHLHFHLQDSPHFGQGAGLPAFFNDYAADGRRVARGEPQRGQSISVR